MANPTYDERHVLQTIQNSRDRPQASRKIPWQDAHRFLQRPFVNLVLAACCCHFHIIETCSSLSATLLDILPGVSWNGFHDFLARPVQKTSDTPIDRIHLSIRHRLRNLGSLADVTEEVNDAAIIYLLWYHLKSEGLAFELYLRQVFGLPVPYPPENQFSFGVLGNPLALNTACYIYPLQFDVSGWPFTGAALPLSLQYSIKRIKIPERFGNDLIRLYTHLRDNQVDWFFGSTDFWLVVCPTIFHYIGSTMATYRAQIETQEERSMVITSLLSPEYDQPSSLRNEYSLATESALHHYLDDALTKQSLPGKERSHPYPEEPSHLTNINLVAQIRKENREIKVQMDSINNKLSVAVYSLDYVRYWWLQLGFLIRPSRHRIRISKPQNWWKSMKNTRHIQVHSSNVIIDVDVVERCRGQQVVTKGFERLYGINNKLVRHLYHQEPNCLLEEFPIMISEADKTLVTAALDLRGWLQGAIADDHNQRHHWNSVPPGFTGMVPLKNWTDYNAIVPPGEHNKVGGIDTAALATIKKLVSNIDRHVQARKTTIEAMDKEHLNLAPDVRHNLLSGEELFRVRREFMLTIQERAQLVMFCKAMTKGIAPHVEFKSLGVNMSGPNTEAWEKYQMIPGVAV